MQVHVGGARRISEDACRHLQWWTHFVSEGPPLSLTWPVFVFVSKPLDGSSKSPDYDCGSQFDWVTLLQASWWCEIRAATVHFCCRVTAQKKCCLSLGTLVE